MAILEDKVADKVPFMIPMEGSYSGKVVRDSHKGVWKISLGQRI
jgi:hypothetical protein